MPVLGHQGVQAQFDTHHVVLTAGPLVVEVADNLVDLRRSEVCRAHLHCLFEDESFRLPGRVVPYPCPTKAHGLTRHCVLQHQTHKETPESG